MKARPLVITIRLAQEYDEGYELFIQGDGLLEVVDAIKSWVPTFLRKYNSEKKLWWINHKAADMEKLADDLSFNTNAKIVWQAERKASAQKRPAKDKNGNPTYGQPPPPSSSAGATGALTEGEARKRWFDKWKTEWELQQASKRRGAAAPKDVEFARLHLTADAPQAVVAAVRNALAKIYHPDVRKDGEEKMKLINTTYDRIVNTYF